METERIPKSLSLPRYHLILNIEAPKQSTSKQPKTNKCLNHFESSCSQFLFWTKGETDLWVFTRPKNPIALRKSWSMLRVSRSTSKRSSNFSRPNWLKFQASQHRTFLESMIVFLKSATTVRLTILSTRPASISSSPRPSWSTFDSNSSSASPQVACCRVTL